MTRSAWCFWPVQSQPIGYLVICFDHSREYRGKGAWVDELYVTASRRGKISGRDRSIRPKVLRANMARKFCVLK
jgi:hypothetical protein